MGSKKNAVKNFKLKGKKKDKKNREEKKSKGKKSASQKLDKHLDFDRVDAPHLGLTRNTLIIADLPPGIEVKDCGYGRGVFVTQAFPAEEIIGQVSGEIITDKDYGSQNCMDLGKHGVLEPAPPFQYLNHSCEPNCELVWEAPKNKKTGRREPRIFVQSIRPIAPGEQLTLDYAWPASDAIPCQCQSTDCRGWVVAEDELHLVATIIAV